LIESSHRCAVCGEPCPLERAHIVPWSKSNDNSQENLICLCANCHQRADTEKWGTKALQEYKVTPWANRKFTGKETIPQLSKINITIDMDIKDFGELQRRMLEYALAAFLNIQPNSIKIETVRSGSVKVTLLVPSEYVPKLLLAMKDNDAELLSYLKPLNVIQLASDFSETKEALLHQPSILAKTPKEVAENDPRKYSPQKAEQLRETRLRLDWSQQMMAEALGLDPSYLSQLESGRRKLDDWYLKKAAEIEKTNAANIFGSVTPESLSMQSTAESCVAYLKQFLATCKDPAKIIWAYVELQEHFPLDKWTNPEAGVIDPPQPKYDKSAMPKSEPRSSASKKND